MRTRRKSVWIFICGGIAVVLLLTLLREREPQYKGRSLTRWVEALAGGYANDPDYSLRDAEEAIRAIGTNGIPFYLKWFQYKERPWRDRLAKQAARLPGDFGNAAANLVRDRAGQMQLAAFSALFALGPDAKPALPFLKQQFGGPYREMAMSVIGHMGDVGLPTILTVLTNGSPTALRMSAIRTLDNQWNLFTDISLIQSVLTERLEDPDREVALCAAAVLCTHKIAQDRAMQVFSQALESGDRQLRRRAESYSLEQLLRRNFSAMSLIQYLQNTNSPLSQYAADSLGTLAEINAKLPENALPALTNSLTDLRPKVRLNAAAALGYFRNAPEIVGPALIDAFQDSDPAVRRRASNSFFGLAPYSVLNTRAKPYTAPADSSILTRLLDHPDIRIREMATNAFQKLRQE